MVSELLIYDWFKVLKNKFIWIKWAQILNLLQRKSQNMYNILFSDAVLEISLRYHFFLIYVFIFLYLTVLNLEIRMYL